MSFVLIRGRRLVSTERRGDKGCVTSTVMRTRAVLSLVTSPFIESSTWLNYCLLWFEDKLIPIRGGFKHIMWPFELRVWRRYMRVNFPFCLNDLTVPPQFMSTMSCWIERGSQHRKIGRRCGWWERQQLSAIDGQGRGGAPLSAFVRAFAFFRSLFIHTHARDNLMWAL